MDKAFQKFTYKNLTVSTVVLRDEFNEKKSYFSPKKREKFVKKSKFLPIKQKNEADF